MLGNAIAESLTNAVKTEEPMEEDQDGTPAAIPDQIPQSLADESGGKDNAEEESAKEEEDKSEELDSTEDQSAMLGNAIAESLANAANPEDPPGNLSPAAIPDTIGQSLAHESDGKDHPEEESAKEEEDKSEELDNTENQAAMLDNIVAESLANGAKTEEPMEEDHEDAPAAIPDLIDQSITDQSRDTPTAEDHQEEEEKSEEPPPLLDSLITESLANTEEPKEEEKEGEKEEENLPAAIPDQIGQSLADESGGTDHADEDKSDDPPPVLDKIVAKTEDPPKTDPSPAIPDAIGQSLADESGGTDHAEEESATEEEDKPEPEEDAEEDDDPDNDQRMPSIPGLPIGTAHSTDGDEEEKDDDDA
jgi:hypothetical protein